MKTRLAHPIVDPSLLNAQTRGQPLTVFLCGPGYGSISFQLRQDIKDVLEQQYAARVHFGEDLGHMRRRRTKRVDLQTLEARFAHTVDFTILMLDSPGAIAELGTFSMIENICARLFVIVSDQYYGDESYIGRGPLSLISSYSANNIIYYNKKNVEEIRHGLMYPVCLYKFIKAADGHRYYQNAIKQFERDKFPDNAYVEYFNPLHDKFIDAVTLSAINILQNPTYAELVRWLRLEPDHVTNALARLFGEKRIEKIGAMEYRAVNGYSDSVLWAFDSSLLSKRRAEILAAA